MHGREGGMVSYHIYNVGRHSTSFNLAMPITSSPLLHYSTVQNTFPLWVQVESEVVVWFLGSNKLNFVHQIYR